MERIRTPSLCVEINSLGGNMDEPSPKPRLPAAALDVDAGASPFKLGIGRYSLPTTSVASSLQTCISTMAHS